MTKKITDLTEATAADITNPAVVWVGADNSGSSVSNKVKLSEVAKLAEARTYATLADLAADADLREGVIYSTLGHTTAGVGAGEYYFVAGDTTTADGGHVITHAAGRIHNKNKLIANIDQFGAIPAVGVDQAAKIQSAINTGRPLDGKGPWYRINQTLFLNAATSNIDEINCALACVNHIFLSVDITDGSAAVQVAGFKAMQLDRLHIRSKKWYEGGWDYVAMNFTGIKFQDSRYWTMGTVSVYGAEMGVNWNQVASGSFKGTIENLILRYNRNSFRAYSWSGVSGTITVEQNLEGKPYEIYFAHDTHLTIMDQSNHKRTDSSTINNCFGCDFTWYNEDSTPESAIPLVKVGLSDRVVDCNFRGYIYCGSLTPMFEFDRIDGGENNLVFALYGRNDPYTVTDKTRNFRKGVAANSMAWPYIAPIVGEVNYSDGPAWNYIPDPLGDFGQIGTLARAVTTNNATVADETTIRPPFARRSLKVTATAATNDCYARVRYDFADWPHLAALKGQTIGCGFWANVPTSHPCSALNSMTRTPGATHVASNEIGPYVDFYDGFVHSNVYWNLHFDRFKMKGTDWYFCWYENIVNASATYIDVTFYAKPPDASYTADANTLAYFAGPVLWLGGIHNATRFRNGEFAQHPSIANPFARIGAGTPASVAYAPIGTVWHRTDGGAGTSTYVKESGNQATSGWAAK